MVIIGAGEGIRTLDPNLGKVVLSVCWSFPDPNPAWKDSENQLSKPYPDFLGLDGDFRNPLTHRLREADRWLRAR